MSAGESPTRRQSSGFAPSPAIAARTTSGAGLQRNAVTALHVVEILQQSKVLQHQLRTGGGFGRGRRFSATQRGQRLRSRPDRGACPRAFCRDSSVNTLRSACSTSASVIAGIIVAEHCAQFQPDVASQEIEADGRASGRCQHFALCAANIGRGIEQRAVDIEQVNRDSAESQDRGYRFPAWRAERF